MSICAAISNLKGGVGKTTATWFLGLFAARQGFRTLLVDADPQRSLSVALAAASDRAADMELPRVVAMDDSMRRPDQLPAMLKDVDLCLIDCPPRLGPTSRSAFMVASTIVLPVSTGYLDLCALSKTLTIVEEARQLRPELEVFLVAMRHNENTADAGRFRDTIAELNEGRMPPAFPVTPHAEHLDPSVFHAVKPRLIGGRWPFWKPFERAMVDGPVYPTDPRVRAAIESVFRELFGAEASGAV